MRASFILILALGACLFSSAFASSIVQVGYQAELDSGTGWRDNASALAGSALRLTQADFFTTENVWYDFSGSSVYSAEGELTAVQHGGALTFGSGKVTVHSSGDYLVTVSSVVRRAGGSGAVQYDLFWGTGVNAAEPSKALASVDGESDNLWITGTSSQLFLFLDAGDTLTLYAKQIGDGASTPTNFRVADITWTIQSVS